MQVIEKTAWEEYRMTHNFKRKPGLGWLRAGETISSIGSVTVLDENDVSVTSLMLGATEISGTKVTYVIKGGTVGKSYFVFLKILTSEGNKFEDVIQVDVVRRR